MGNDAISRSAAVKEMERIALQTGKDKVRTIARCTNAIELLPALDVQPVVHARWIYTGEVDYDNNHHANCSHCGTGDDHKEELINKVPYCWNCGARMDVEESTC